MKDFNISKFMNDTRPSFMVWSCKLDQIECRWSWTFQLTHLGYCLQLDPYDAVKKQKINLDVLPAHELYIFNYKLSGHNMSDIYFEVSSYE